MLRIGFDRGYLGSVGIILPMIFITMVTETVLER